MEDIWETNARNERINSRVDYPKPIEPRRPEVSPEVSSQSLPHLPIKDRISRLEDELKLKAMREETEKTKENWKWPVKWKRGLNKSTKAKQALDKVLVIYLNVKNEIEPPVLLPLYSGNIIIYKNKAYEFDPRALLTVAYKKGKIAKVVLIREIDRRPVSNLDWDEVRKRGDSTDSDEILLKMVTKAFIEKQIKKPMNKTAIFIVVIMILAAIAFFFFFKGG